MSNDILMILADLYRSRGPLHQDVPARSFLRVMPQAAVEIQLGELLDAKELAVFPGGRVSMSIPRRVSVLTRAVLDGWVRSAGVGSSRAELAYVEAIRGELAALVRAGVSAPDGSALVERAVPLAAVRAMADLDVRAIDVVAGLGEQPRALLRRLATLPEAACLSLAELRARTREFVGQHTAAA